VARPAAAQELGVSVVHLRSDHELLESSTGFGVDAGIPLSSRVSLRLGYQASQATFAAFGSTCVGLVPPEQDCAFEDRTDHARTRSLLLSVPLTLREMGRFAFALVPGVQWTSVETEQHGERSGRTRRASKRNPGVSLGVDVSFAPFGESPLAVVLSGSHSVLDPFRTEHIADGYTPFEERIGLTRAALGIFLRR
jgi:hypothetical protein